MLVFQRILQIPISRPEDVVVIKSLNFPILTMSITSLTASNYDNYIYIKIHVKRLDCVKIVKGETIP